MNSLSLSKLAMPTAAFAMLLTACGGGRVVVNTPRTPAPTVVAAAAPAPSPVVVATVPPQPAPPATVALGPSPGSEYVRVEGYYNWVGDHYEWVPPTWSRAPRPGATYVPGHWESTAGGYVWRPAYWQ